MHCVSRPRQRLQPKTLTTAPPPHPCTWQSAWNTCVPRASMCARASDPLRIRPMLALCDCMPRHSPAPIVSHCCRPLTPICLPLTPAPPIATQLCHRAGPLPQGHPAVASNDERLRGARLLLGSWHARMPAWQQTPRADAWPGGQGKPAQGVHAAGTGQSDTGCQRRPSRPNQQSLRSCPNHACT
jgi:hypothetical protein